MISLLVLAAAAAAPNVIKEETIATCYEFPVYDTKWFAHERVGDYDAYTYRIPLRTKETVLVLVLDPTGTELLRADYVRASMSQYKHTEEMIAVSEDDFIKDVQRDLQFMEFSRCAPAVN